MAENYCTAAELQSRLWPDGVTPDGVDVLITNQVIEAVSRWIDIFTGRRFYTTTENETRYFTAEFSDELFVGDILEINTLKTDEDGDRTYEITWQTTDYDLFPYNASLDSEPYTSIQTTPEGDYAFPLVAKGVEISGKFGYCATEAHPADVREACILQCERMYKRKGAPFGIAGNEDLGELRLIPRLDVDVQELLIRYQKVVW